MSETQIREKRAVKGKVKVVEDDGSQRGPCGS